MMGSPFVEATCFDVGLETWNVKTFRFRVADSRQAFEFQAGQYVTVGLEIDGQTLYRCYTISCAPGTRGTGELEITVKRSPEGIVSSWLHENLKVGSKIQVSYATGDFVLPDDYSEKLLFIAGGVGITPLMSMARSLHSHSGQMDIKFLQFARTPADILFRDELIRMGDEAEGVSAHFFASRESDGNCLAGRLCIDLLDKAVPDWKTRRILCCGPDSFMSDMREAFVGSGGNPARFHQESFNIPEAPPAHTVTNTGVAIVRLSVSGFDVTCEPGTSILDAVHASPIGVKIPNACKSGVCGTCKLRKLEGEVDMQHNGGITDEEIEEGFILTCCSIPLSDVTIEY